MPKTERFPTARLANVAAASGVSEHDVAAVFNALIAEIRKKIGGGGAGRVTIPGVVRIERKTVLACPTWPPQRQRHSGPGDSSQPRRPLYPRSPHVLPIPGYKRSRATGPRLPCRLSRTVGLEPTLSCSHDHRCASVPGGLAAAQHPVDSIQSERPGLNRRSPAPRTNAARRCPAR